MERPERPSRHKSKPVKYPIRPSFSSDSDSEMNDEIYIPTSNFETGFHNNMGAGPSTSNSAAPQNNQESTSNASFLDVAHEVIIGASSSPEPARRKRPSDSMTASSAASVIFDSVDSLIGSSSSRQNRPAESMEPRFHNDMTSSRAYYPIDCMRPPGYKLKRPNGPIDLTPSSSGRDIIPGPVFGNSFALRDSTNLAANAEAAQSAPFSKSSIIPLAGFPPALPPRDPLAATSRILSQFDEMCSYPMTSYRRRSRPCNVRFSEAGRFEAPTSDSGPGNTLNSNRQSPRTRNSGSIDDYSELVNNFFLNPYPPTVTISDSQRSPTGTGAGPSGDAQGPDRLRPEVMNEDLPRIPQASSRQETNDELLNSLAFVSVNNSASPHEGEVMEQNNEEVIILGTPERPISPDFVPSSRSPSPMPRYPSPVPTKRDKPQRSSAGDVPMTLQELNQTLVSLLECPVCLDHATPPIYQCGKGHILCQNCHPRLTICPICRSRLPGDRNSAMEKVAEKLMYPCKNTVTGCSEMLKLDDKRQHEEGCGFRHYACIVSTCHWKGYKPELVVHLQSNHPEKLLSGDVKEVQIPLGVPGGNMFSSHHWVQSAHNEVFNVIFNIDHYKRLLKGCVIFIGSPERAVKFTYKFELKQQVSPFRVLSYSRETHTDIPKPGQALMLSGCDFNINIDMARIYRTDSSPPNTVPVHISILAAE